MKRWILLAISFFILAIGSVAAYNPYAPNQFDVMERTSWEYKAVYALAQAGLTNGDMSKFAPTYSLTRYEMTEMVASAIKQREKATVEQQGQIDKLANEFAEDLKYLEPATATKKTEPVQGEKFDWKEKQETVKK